MNIGCSVIWRGYFVNKMIRLPVIWKKSYIYDIQINPG